MDGRPWLALALAGLALAAIAPEVSGLSCPQRDHDWGELRVVELSTGNTTAEVPFPNASRGYGCGIGDAHDLHGDWLAWTAGPFDGDRTLHVLDLTENETASGSVHVDRPNSVSVDPPHVFVLQSGEGKHWTVQRFTVEPGGDGVIEHRNFSLRGSSASLHGSLLHVLSSEEDGTVSVRDLAENRSPIKEAQLPEEGEEPWRLLGGDGTWAALASSAEDRQPGRFLGEDADAWLWRIETGDVHALSLPPAEGQKERRLGVAVDFDSGDLYLEGWEGGHPWSPWSFWTLEVPSGEPEKVRGHGFLISGIAVDEGHAVTGSWLEEVPEEPAPNVTGGGQKDRLPGPGLAVGLAVPVAVAVLSRVRLRRG